METEIEAKFTDIDPRVFRQTLKSAGAVMKYSEVLMRRKTFDDAEGRLGKIGGWIRVRDEGKQVTLSYKQLNDRSLHGTKEITVSVNDFDKTCEIFKAVGFVKKSYQETKREAWMLDGTEITIDTWPWIPSFTEIEGPNEKVVKQVAQKLSLDWNTAMYGSVEPVYQMHYAFTDDEINNWPSITFIDPPAWLLARKKIK